MVEVVLLLQKSAISPYGILALVLTNCQTLTYGSEKLLVHSNGHTPVHRVGSRTKLCEGITQKAYVCDVLVYQTPTHCARRQKEQIRRRPLDGKHLSIRFNILTEWVSIHSQGTLATLLL